MLLKAVAQRKIKLIKLLLQGGVNIDIQGYDGKTPLIVACSFVPEDFENETLVVLIEFLLKNGASPNLQDIKGRTALMYAFRHALSVDIIDKLLQNGAEPMITDFDGLNAFDFISDTIWPKYRHYMKSSEQYKRRLMKSEENNNVVDVKKESSNRRQSGCAKPRTSLNIVQNSRVHESLLAHAKSDAFRRTSDILSSVYDTKDVFRRKTKSFSADANEKSRMRARANRLCKNFAEKSNYDERLNHVKERLHSCAQLQTTENAEVCKKSETTGDKQMECVKKSYSYCKKTNIGVIFMNDFVQRDLPKSASLIRVSSIDKATVEDGMIKTLAKLPPIQ